MISKLLVLIYGVHCLMILTTFESLRKKGLRHVLKYQKNIIFCKQIIGGRLS